VHGIAAAVGVVTGLVVDAGHGRAGDSGVAEGDVVTVDGTTGRVARGGPRRVVAEEGAHLRRLRAWMDG